MSPIIELLLDEKLSIEQLFAWINGDIKDDELEVYDHLKLSFVPSFLNYLRDQTCSFLHYSGHSNLTPGKATPTLKTTKYISSKRKDLSGHNVKSSSKAKLDFSDSFISTFEKKSSICQRNEGRHDSSSHATNGSFISPQKTSELNAINEASLPSPLRISHNNENMQGEFSSHSKNLRTARTNYSTARQQCGGMSPLSPTKYSSISTPEPKRFSPGDTSTPGRRSPSPRIDNNKDLKSYIKRRSFDEPYFEGRLSDQKVSLAEFIVERKKGKKKNFTKNNSPERIPEENSFVLDLESFPPVGSKFSKQLQPKKRINPTLVSSSGLSPGSTEESSLISSNSFTFSKNQPPHSAFMLSQESDSNSISEDRQQMKHEIKQFSYQEGTFQMSKRDSPPFVSSKRNPTSQNSVTPLPNKVSYKRELNTLSRVYSNLILYNMVPNIMVELYYLFQLLTVNANEYKNLDESDFLAYFGTVHNCVYFSVVSLSCITCCLSHLDKATLKLLGENSRIQYFNPILHTCLRELCEIPPSSKPRAPPKSPILSVSFQSETDNRNNFPTTTAFQIFKKQRDLFYEVIRMWEKNHLNPGWVFNQSLSSKVRTIMNMNENSSINLMHFARLFHFQLIAMCKGNDEVQHQSDVDDLSVLKQLKRERPEKYQRLFERLIRPLKFGGPVPSPSFPGAQEFFHDFIITASNHTFNCFLRDSFISRILQLNEVSSQICEEEEGENVEFAKDEFCSSLKSLRLLAKFLGLLEFLPYQTSGHVPEGVITDQIFLRSQVSPPLPLMEVLKNAAKSRSLVVVIPWVVEYLSMVDSVALHTRHYLTIAFVLIFINKILYTFQLDFQSSVCDKCTISRNFSVINAFNSFYLKVLLGWLFSLPNFPEGLFYTLEEEVDIDQASYEELRSVICKSYSNLCYACLNAQSTNQKYLMNISNGSSSSSDVLSPIKYPEDLSYFSPKKVANGTPSKIPAGGDFSPVKTPSKLLQVSMVDTPDGTPQKPLNEQILSLEDKTDGPHIDMMPIIDHQILLMCCPYIGELKSMLNEFASGLSRNRSNNIRKITPLTSSTDKANEHTERSLQLQLEDNFFHNKPSSTRKIVEFVAERIYSNVLRYLRSDLIPCLKEKYLQQLKIFTLNHMSGSFSTMVDKLTELVEKKTQEMSLDLIVDVREGAMKEMERLSSREELQSSLTFLLPLEVTQTGGEICCQIVKRMATERVMAWLNTHLTSVFCIKELIPNANKFIKSSMKNLNMDNSHSTCNSTNFAATSQVTATLEDQMADNSTASNTCSSKKLQDALPIVATVHDSSLPAPSTLLMQLKVHIRCLMVPKADISPQMVQHELLTQLNMIRDVVLKRKDMRLPLYKALSTLSIDWIVACAVCVPEEISKEVIERTLELWMPLNKGGIFPCPDNLSCFLSARTIMLLGQGPADRQSNSWKKIEAFLTEIVLEHKIISPGVLQENCISLLRYSWPQDILRGISRMINSLFGRLKKHPDFKGDPEITNLLEWVGWVCQEMES